MGLRTWQTSGGLGWCARQKLQLTIGDGLKLHEGRILKGLREAWTMLARSEERLKRSTTLGNS